jgi:hypothetical protein
MSNLTELPCSEYSRRLIQKLVTTGYLRDDQRHSFDAVRNAMERLRIDSRQFFDHQGSGPKTK